MSETKGWVEVRRDGAVVVRWWITAADGLVAEGGFVARRGTSELANLQSALGRLQPTFAARARCGNEGPCPSLQHSRAKGRAASAMDRRPTT
jgi:hypothetical protein